MGLPRRRQQEPGGGPRAGERPAAGGRAPHNPPAPLRPRRLRRLSASPRGRARGPPGVTPPPGGSGSPRCHRFSLLSFGLPGALRRRLRRDGGRAALWGATGPGARHLSARASAASGHGAGRPRTPGWLRGAGGAGGGAGGASVPAGPAEGFRTSFRFSILLPYLRVRFRECRQGYQGREFQEERPGDSFV